MCNFASFVSDPDKPIPGRFMIMDWPIRERIMSGELNYEPDSHTSIAHFFGYTGEKEDTLNKYEYNPILGVFKIDQINHKINDSREAEKWARKLNFKKIVPYLIIKPIINPFTITPPEITSDIIGLLKQWKNAWASVWDSVGASVWDSVGASVEASVGASVWYSVEASVWDSVGASVEASVRDAIEAYAASFLKTKHKNLFIPAIKLWNMGLVPSFDGKLWRIHGKKNAEVLWTE